MSIRNRVAKPECDTLYYRHITSITRLSCPKSSPINWTRSFIRGHVGLPLPHRFSSITQQSLRSRRHGRKNTAILPEQCQCELREETWIYEIPSVETEIDYPSHSECVLKISSNSADGNCQYRKWCQECWFIMCANWNFLNNLMDVTNPFEGSDSCCHILSELLRF
jgi:hypothetical protein